MLQGREINLLFLSPAPGIDPGSAGVRLQCFTHRPRRPTNLAASFYYVLDLLLSIKNEENIVLPRGALDLAPNIPTIENLKFVSRGREPNIPTHFR